MGLPPQPKITVPRSLRRPFRPGLVWSLATVGLIVLCLRPPTLPKFFSAFTSPSPTATKLSQFQLESFQVALQKCRDFESLPLHYPFPVPEARSNPRWNPSNGQNETILLRNATLFDGESILDEPVDIVFSNGIIKSAFSTSELIPELPGVKILQLNRRFVTPGLIDMHSHHMAMTWPNLPSTDDVNEMSGSTGPLTPMMRILDSLKAYDQATAIIASGGVTSSLILPGSANIMAGEGVVVKNAMRSGNNREYVVEELLLEYGVPEAKRRRYMKMAWGENPRGIYDHVRMANSWILRKHLTRAEELRQKQDAWCLSAASAQETGDLDAMRVLMSPTFIETGGLPESLELESTVALLRGKVGVNIHCYESEDFESMLRISKEFGFRIRALHHALEAWKVPEMIKESGDNITVATFSTFGLYKKEAYEANLWAGKVLADHGVPVAYKSDHSGEELNAKYLMFQAATAHSFQFPELLALQSVTSVPAKSLRIDHRVGFVRPGYDADIVIWDSHPLLVGSTPLQVYIDGKTTLDDKRVKESLSNVTPSSYQRTMILQQRKVLDAQTKAGLCACVEKPEARIAFTGITHSFLAPLNLSATKGENLTLVMENGKIICLGSYEECLATIHATETAINLTNGHVLPGLTAFSANLGLTEIVFEDSTGDGAVSKKTDVLDPDNLVYAKYGVHLEGRAFGRARIAGITKAVTAPVSDLETPGFVGGVSVGIKTSGDRNILNGGIFKDDVALHFVVGQGARGSDSTPTISLAVGKLRKILADNNGKDSLYGKAANGTIPIVVHVENKYDMMQIIKIKKDYSAANIVILGGSGLPFVANELAAANISVILTSLHSVPDTWEKRDALSGPPLTKSPAQILTDAGVLFGIAIAGFSDSHIHNLPIEAGWAAKYAGLSSDAAVNLVSRNVEDILGLEVQEETRDFVVYEGNPLEFGASVVAAFDGVTGRALTCWPEAT